jgi:hypothetical protein
MFLLEITIVLIDISFAVTFSRIDPGGKLVIGFRKSSNSTDTQVGHKIFHFTVSMVVYLNYTYFFLSVNMINGYCLNRMLLHLHILTVFLQREPPFLVELIIFYREVIVVIFSVHQKGMGNFA